MAAPEILTTFDGSLVGDVNGVNTTFSGPALVQPGMVFLNGQALTRGPDFSSDLNILTLSGGNTPEVGNVVTEAVYGFNDPLLPFNLPTQFTTNDGTISGERNGANNVFTLETTKLVTEMLLFWNGLLTVGADFTWMCQMSSSAGGWTTTITVNGPDYLQDFDRLTAQVFYS